MRLYAFPLAVATLHSSPTITKVEPPNWWTGHTRNPIQLLLTGSDLKGASVTSESRAMRVEIRRTSDDGRYAFAYVMIASNAKPAKYRFHVHAGGAETTFEFALES